MTAPPRVSAPAARGGTHSIAFVAASALVLAAVCSLFVLQPFSPWFPNQGLDPSWMVVLGEAAASNARWGVDTVFTYGPGAALVTLYGGADYAARTLPLLIGLGLVFGIAVAGAVGIRQDRRGATFAVTIVAVAMAWSQASRDTLLILLPLPVLLVDLARAPGRTGPLLAALACAAGVGLAAISKTTVALCALPVFAVGDVASLLRRRCPGLLPGFALGFLAAEAIYRQRLGDLGALVHLQGEVASGYSDAMTVPGPAWQVWLFLAFAAPVVALAAVPGPSRAGAAAAPLGLAWTLFILFKAGFVRQDLHVLIATTGLGLCAAIVGAVHVLPRRRAAGYALVGISLALLVLVNPFLVARAMPKEQRTAAFAEALASRVATWPRREVEGFLAALADPGGLQERIDAARRAAFASIAATTPLPRLDGSVDILPSQQSTVIANGLDYRPRPVFQSYSAYTPDLIAANRRYVAGPEGPAWMLFGPETPTGGMAIDNRFPGFPDGALWPDLVRLYRPERRIGSLVALRRRDVPAPDPLGPARSVVAGFGDEIPVDGQEAVFARISLHPTLFGRLATLLFRSPVLSLAVRTADGSTRSFRFVPGIASSGFVLSPLVFNASDYTALATGRTSLLARRSVAGFRVVGDAFATVAFEARIDVELRPLRAPADPAPPAPTPSAWDALREAAPVDTDGNAMAVEIGSRLSLPTLGLGRVDLGYGLDGDEAARGRVCFTARSADGLGTVLWRDCLDGPDATRLGARRLDLGLAPGTSEIVLETDCTLTCDGLTPFWSRPDPPSADAQP